MAAPDTTELLADIRQVADIPQADPSEIVNPDQEVYTDLGILKLATRELRGKIARMVLSTRADFFVATTDYTITTQGAKYRIPSRAIGAKLQNLRYNDGVNWLKIMPTEEGDTLQNKTSGYYFQGPYIVFLMDTSSGTIRMYYYVRHSKLVATSAINNIASIATNTLNLAETRLSQFANGVKVDLVRASSPFDIIQADLTISSTGASSVTFASLSGVDVNPGDYLCLSEQTPIAQIPWDIYDILVQRCAQKIMQIKGDSAGAALSGADLRELELQWASAISPRGEISHRKIKNRRLLGV